MWHDDILTAEEACEALMNDDDFGELESADYLDESFADSRIQTRGGRSRDRGTQTPAASHNLPLNKRLASTISDDEINSSKDPSWDSEFDEPLSEGRSTNYKGLLIQWTDWIKDRCTCKCQPNFLLLPIAFDRQISGWSS